METEKEEPEFSVSAGTWVADDIMAHYDVTREEAEEFMFNNAGRFSDRMIELGWEVWEHLAQSDGLKSKPYDDDDGDE